MAFDAGSIDAKLTLDRNPFQRSLAEARAEAKRFAQERYSPTLTLADDLAKAKIDEMMARLTRLDHKRVNVKVDVDRSSLATIERFLGGAGGAVGGIPFLGGILSAPFKLVGALASGLQKLPALLEQVGQFATTAFQTVAGTINDLRTGATTIGQVLGSAVSGLISLVASAGTALLTIGLLVVAFGALASVVVSLVAALAALAASFAAAVAGAGALFVGAFAAAIPVIGVLVAFFVRFAAVMKAHQAAQQAATQAAQQHKQALTQQHQAALTLATAQQNLKDQTVAAYQAMKQSVVDYQHALLSVEQTRLGIEGARLSLRQAKQDLKDFLQQTGGGNALSALMKSFTNVDFNPESARAIFGKTTGKGLSGDNLLKLQELLFGVKSATLGVKTANQSYQDSLDNLSQAESKRNDFLKNGIAAYKPYESALTNVRKAQDQLHTATTRVSAAQTAYEQKLKGLSTTEQGFLGTLSKILKTFGDIAKAVSAPIFKGIESSFGSLQKLISDPGIQTGLVGIGRAIGSVIAQFSKSLTTKPWRDAIGQFLSAGAQLTRSGGRVFSGFLTVLRQIATATIPHVISGVRSLGDWFVNLGKKPGAIKSAVDFLVRQFKIWLDVTKALGGLVVAFIRNAAGAGGKLAGHLASILRHWTDWLNKHPGAVKRFFEDAVGSTKSLMSHLGKIAGFMGDIIGYAEKLSKFVKGSGIHSVWDLIEPISPHGSSGGLHAAPRPPKGFHYDLGTGKLEPDTPKRTRHGAPPPRTPFASTASAGIVVHSSVHTSDPDPQHYASKLADHIGKAAQREAQKKGLLG